LMTDNSYKVGGGERIHLSSCCSRVEFSEENWPRMLFVTGHEKVTMMDERRRL